jgi:hypothetical protein
MSTDQELYDDMLGYFDTDCLFSFQCLMSAESVLLISPQLYSDEGVRLTEEIADSTAIVKCCKGILIC